MRNPIADGLREIEADLALRIYGACLAFGHVVCWAWWRPEVPAVLDRSNEPLCWPFLEDCHVLRVLDHGGIERVLWLMLALAVASAVLLPMRRFCRAGFALLAAATVVKLALLVMDYRLRMNQHIMHTLALGAFLLMPGKRDLLRYLLVAFYLAAGALKWNREWLSGAALYEPLWIPAAWVPAACLYVNVLETFLVWGVLARRGWLFWATFLQLANFHLFSWPVVGFFYPLLMFGLVAIFPLARRIAPADPEGGLLAALVRGRARRSHYAFLGVVAALQVVPRVIPGDEDITGEGRLFALHMFDSRAVCRGHAVLRSVPGPGSPPPVTINLRMRLAQRIQCDPIVYFDRARTLCRERRADPTFADLDLRLFTRRATEPLYRTVIDLRDFCARDLHYDLWRKNAWIATGPPEHDLEAADLPGCREGCARAAGRGCDTTRCVTACLGDPEEWRNCDIACEGQGCGCVEPCWR